MYSRKEHKSRPPGTSHARADGSCQVLSAFSESVNAALIGLSGIEFSNFVELIRNVCVDRGRLYVMGNGGSAATATHMVCDLTKATSNGRVPQLRAFALADNNSVLTALANDITYDDVFSRQIDGLVDHHDAVVAITVSGTSVNIIEGLRAARRKGAHTAGLLGWDVRKIGQLLDIALQVPSSDFGVVETAHLAIVHAVAATLSALAPA